MSNIYEVTTGTFESEVLESDLPVLVNFQSPWCDSCRKMEPVLERLGSEFEGQIKVVNVNAETDPELAERYDISAVPTLIVFKDARPLHRIVGVTSLAWLEAVLAKAIPPAESRPATPAFA